MFGMDINEFFRILSDESFADNMFHEFVNESYDSHMTLV